ncbi:Per1-like protein [Schizothecium vesticola]|uniref:Post-GPI attachment to proteins factor 3 n=1 Tax=Schizothecium vesticola TaxID=314040 RepID=A0AA40EUY5_9PEZI|nr:Per1-like protein [Schizothecium vesticola]
MVTLAPGHAGRRGLLMLSAALLLCCVLFARPAAASAGDRLPEFRECIKICERENCGPDADHQTPIPLYRRLLLWSCPAECDYTCQHIITDQRLSAVPAPAKPVVQFHGKWPFTRVLGVQEPASVLFSAGNWWAHYSGLRKLREQVPASYPLRRFYLGFAYVSMAAWTFSIVFHTRDFAATEQLDYFGAGAAVLYGLYSTAVRMFRLERRTPRARAALKAWTGLCVGLFVMHVAYLKLWAWDYTYNMAANVAVGAVQNAMWSWYSVGRYRKSGRGWMAWPGVAVAWITGAMSLELLDFPPLLGALDAHSLWHLLTIAPATLWYK